MSEPLREALDAGQASVKRLVRTDLQLAQTHAARDWMKGEDRVVGYKRVLGGSKSCSLCAEAARKLYHTASLMPVHERCHCGIAPANAQDASSMEFHPDDAGIHDSELGMRLDSSMPVPEGDFVPSIDGSALRPSQQEVMDKAMADIRSVHSVPDDLTVPTAVTDEVTAFNTNTGQIQIRPDLAPDQAFHVVHEYGHFLDHTLFGEAGRDASFARGGEMSDVMSAIRSSRAFAIWEEDAGRSFSSEQEVWARAYERWVAIRSGSKAMRAAQDKFVHKGSRGTQAYWDDDDFEPIAKAIDELMAKKGIGRPAQA